MRVLVIDDHEIVCSGFRSMIERLAAQLDATRPLEFTACTDLAQVEPLAGKPFDLVLLDYSLPGKVSGLEALASVKAAFEGTPVVVVSGLCSPRLVHDVIEHGAAGFFPKVTSEREMQAALQALLTRGVYLPPIALLGAEDEPEASDDVLSPEHLEEFFKAELTPRQQEVFALALRGMPNKVIARKLGIAEGTVKLHLAMVYRALGVRNRVEAMYRVLSADAAQVINRL